MGDISRLESRQSDLTIATRESLSDVITSPKAIEIKGYYFVLILTIE